MTYPLTSELALAQVMLGNSVESSTHDAYYFNGSFLICNGLVYHSHSLPSDSYRILGTR